ncbi:MAG: 23S rRNA (adenine(2503)-C(2))-methyltransferase RlmN [Lachnospiraceae bacterium]|nr:23S rRNA (adenine(2503)-C(2))-methyltransferase RlmN [Lachnospiraceae bacterium]
MDIKSMTLDELTEYMKEQGYQKYRAKQVYDWCHVKLVRSVDEMTNIPKDIKDFVREDFVSLEVVERLVSSVDGTNKFVLRLADGNVIESVFMPYNHGNSVCISSQAGCRMGCKFCASTLMGLERNLTASEMLDQIYVIEKILGQRVSNVVVMGTGEPLDNYDNLLKFIRILTDENGLNISQRNITVSSCGLVPEIKRLAKEHLTITFALSLHAATDERRRELMPIANKYSIDEVLDACKYYFYETGRRVTFEYSLVAGQNDTENDAKLLGQLLKGFPCHVNLIPVNPIKERDYKKADRKSIEKFKVLLEKNAINVTIRRSMGKDIDAACGQLRKAYIEKETGEGGFR